MKSHFTRTVAHTPQTEIQSAETYCAGDRNMYKLVDRWIAQVTTLSVWHFIEDIEDINAIVHLKLFSGLKAQRFRGESTLRTYVQRIARYTCIDQVRYQRMQRDVNPGDLPLPAAEATPEQIHEEEERYQIFVNIFRSIGPECQKLWRMIFSESLNYKEIGEKLHLPEGTVKRKVHECKKNAIELRQRMI